MKHWRNNLFAVIATLGLTMVGAYGLVTARRFPETWVYHTQPNFRPLFLSTAVFLLFYNTTVQLTMYYWYRWELDRLPYYIQKLFPRIPILAFAIALLLFIEFVLGVGGTTLMSSGYMKVEFPLFLLYFIMFSFFTIFMPCTNPWYNLIKKEILTPITMRSTIELQHKQETLHLFFEGIPVFIFVRKRCVCIDIQGRQLIANKLNSTVFTELAESSNYIRISRTTFVRRENFEGYTVQGRERYAVFVPEVQSCFDKIMGHPLNYRNGYSKRERTIMDFLKISETYMAEVRRLLNEKE